MRLFTGVTTIKTRVGTVTLTTKPIESVIESRNSDFLSDLQTQLTAVTTKPKSGADLAQTCNSIAVGLAQSGITSISDVAYSLVFLSLKELNSTSDLLACLVNRQYAMAAANLDPKLFAGYPNFSTITPAAVDSYYGREEQPAYVLVAPKLDDLLSYLPQYTRNVLRPPNADKAAAITVCRWDCHRG